MAFRPNYTPAGFDELLTPSAPIAVPRSFAAAAQPTQAVSGTLKTPDQRLAAPGSDIPLGDDEYTQKLEALKAQQASDLQNYSTQNERISDQLALQKQIDDLQSRINGYPAEREKAMQEFLAKGRPVYSDGGGINADGTPNLGTPQGIAAANPADFKDPFDVNAGQAQLAELQKQLADLSNGFASGRDALTKQQKEYYDRVAATVQALREHAVQQKAIDAENARRAAAYQSQVDPYNQGVGAYDKYVSDQTAWQKDADQLNADIAAGKYAVDPFAFLHGQHSVPEIEELRKQINAGNMRPNMGVPTLRAAPTAVTRPGEAPTAPQLKDNAPDVHVDDDVAKTLGYHATAPKPITLAQVTKTPVSEAPQPTTPVKAANPEAKAKPLTNPGTVDQSVQQPPKVATQQTAQSSPLTTQSTSQTQNAPTPAAPVNPSASLPPQTAGSVAGQAPANSSDNSEGSKPQATPNALANPAPFKDPDKDEDKDKKWEL